MNNLFGKTLRSQMEKAGIKESELANALSYDTTYISKWINGSKLPSSRNVERIIGQIVDYIIARTPEVCPANREEQWQTGFRELKYAYNSDSSYLAFQAYNNNQMSFLYNKQELIQLTREAALQSLRIYDGKLSITATFDILKLYGKEFKQFIRELPGLGAKKIELKLALSPEDLITDYYFYATNLLGTIGYLDDIEVSVVAKTKEQPCILIINELLSLQVLWSSAGEVAAVFSMDEKIIKKFMITCQQIIDSSEKILDHADSASLKRTNVQLDSYSDREMWLFFNEPPAMLFPEELMNMFIESAEDETYANYLSKLKNIFINHTSKSKVTLVVYSSVLNQYLSDGTVCIGNVRQHLTEEQTHRHIKYLSEVMRENPNFNFYLIRDTVMFNEDLNNLPSIFLDTYSVNLEDSKKTQNDNYHISMNPRMRETFQMFLEHTLKQSYCTKLTAEDLLRYL